MPTLKYVVEKYPMVTKRERLFRTQRAEVDGHVYYLSNSVEKEEIPKTSKLIRMDLFVGERISPQADGSLKSLYFMQINQGVNLDRYSPEIVQKAYWNNYY